MNRQDIYRLIDEERDRQDRLHPGDELFEHYAPLILGEEVGEVHKALLENNQDELTEELVQVCAVCIRWLENRK